MTRAVARHSLCRAVVAVAFVVAFEAPPLVRRCAAVELRSGATVAHVGGALAAWNVFRLHDDTPSERPSARLDLRVDVTHGEHLHFFGALRAGYDGKIGDPDRGNPFLGMQDVYQDRDLYLDVDEAYLDVDLANVELRIGKQKVSWGQLDEIQPTDHLNPEDLTEVIFRPELDRKIGIPAIRLTGVGGPWTADLVWAPSFTANRLPNRDDRWFPPLQRVPDSVVTPLGAIPVHTRYPDVDPPPHTLASSDVGARLTRFVGGAEVSATVFHGWDKAPTYKLLGTATVVPTGDPTMPAAPLADLRVEPSLHRITVAGGDLAVPLWVLALRAEAAWIQGRFFPLLIQDQVGRDPRLLATVGGAIARVAHSGVAETVALPLPAAELRRQSVQFGVGVDYFMPPRHSRFLIGSERLTGLFVLLQVLETVIVDHDDAFIDDEVESIMSMTVRGAFRDQRVLAELKLAYNPGHGEYFVWPQLAYKLTPTVHALFEARVIGGDRNHTIGQYRDHDGIKIGMRWLF